MGKYDRPKDAGMTSGALSDGRPACVRNVSTIPAEPYERPGTEIAGAARDIGEAVGSRLIGVDLTEIAPGKRSSYLHHHSHKEEFFFVLSGRCKLRLGEQDCELGPGDCVSRPAGTGVPHQFYNPFSENCSVLMFGVMGGKGVEDIVEWPELKRRLVIDAEDKRAVKKY